MLESRTCWKSSHPLLGIIPESNDVLHASNMGLPVTLNEPTSATARAYNDAARKLQGEQVPLVVPTDKVTLFSKLLGRRAA